MNAKLRAEEFLSRTSVTLNGPNPWDPQIHDERLYDRIFSGGTLAVGESYMDGWWDVENMSEFFFRLFHSQAAQTAPLLSVAMVIQLAKSAFLNLQNQKRAYEVGRRHYDIGNDLYEKMLDTRMMYSCGYWKEAKTLEKSQEDKLDLICRKIGLKTGDTVLDIGCGWGGFAAFAAERYGAKVTGITISKEQAALAQQRTSELDVDIRLQDWRTLGGETYTHIVSVGMFEHVGPKNYRVFMQKVRELLSDEGLFLLQTIGNGKTVRHLEPWYDRYIFPNGHLPSTAQITKATDRKWYGEALLTMEDWHNFGSDYDKTLSAWYENFERAWPDIKEKYDERFRRMWKYYLLQSAGMFRARYIHLWQIVFSKTGMVGGYASIR
ncbi:cyclopropane fatty acyl phospholipid synthase [Candidatus Kaiserbacteria bacterium]|nr:cyclopropane fatty acyl phospholipid synthase [Candidatus Kaiserbacteria bacterium]